MTTYRSRLIGRLFYCLISLTFAVRLAHGSPNTTTITDIVYRGDGTPAAGTLLITWPAFTAADAVVNKQIADSAKFNEGLGKVIDGVVECFNASMWAKTKK